jgi:hypothetical protein
MPADAALHLRECSACRDFVRSWDRIELGLQALRDTDPQPSPDFQISLERVPARVTRERVRRSPVIYLRWAAATAVATIAAIGITYALTGRGPIPRERAGSFAIVRPATPKAYVPRPAGLNGDLPIAQTR